MPKSLRRSLHPLPKTGRRKQKSVSASRAIVFDDFLDDLGKVGWVPEKAKKTTSERLPTDIRYRVLHTEPRTASRTLKDFFGRVLPTEKKTLTEVAFMVDISRVTVSYWKSGRNGPGLLDFECLLETMGYRLEIVRDHHENL